MPRLLSRHHRVVGDGGQVRFDLLEGLWADAADALANIFVIEKRAAGRAGFDDPLGQRLADAGQLR
jgi:hypothetical protein